MTDITDAADADAVIDAAIREAVTARGTATMVTVEEAAALAGVSVRTIRRWIQQGHLPHSEDQTGKRVSPADLPLAKQRAGRGHVHRQSTRSGIHDLGLDNMATDTDTAMTEPAVLASATAQMEAIRDQWLRPLVDRIEELSRENGRLEQERDSLRVELDRMRLAPNDAPQERDPASVRDVSAAKASESRTPSGDTLALGWRRWFRRITRGG